MNREQVNEIIDTLSEGNNTKIEELIRKLGYTGNIEIFKNSKNVEDIEDVLEFFINKIEERWRN